jgi:sigma-B regulation protein RsbU (phosphoserine phosphatase)
VSLRRKLLVLFAAIALVPLAILAALELRASQILADKVAAQSESAIAGDITEILARTVQANSVYLNEQADVVELALQLQAAADERALGAPASRAPRYAATAFDGTKAGWPPGTALEQVGPKRVAVSTAVASLQFAPGADRGASDDVDRLSATLPIVRTLARDHPGLFLAQFTALENGAREDFPGHGNFPAGYDSRKSPWYVAAKAAGRRIWSPPIYSAWSGQLAFVAAMPIHAPDGTVTGVAASEVAIVDLLRHLDQRALRAGTAATSTSTLSGISDDLATILVTPAASTLAGKIDVFHILAQRSYNDEAADWRVVPALETIASDDYDGYTALVHDVAAGRSRTVRLPFGGRDSLWAVSPVPALGAAMLLVLPYDRITDAAAAAGATVATTANGQLRNSAILGLLILACVAVISFYVAGWATKSIRELALVAGRIGRGDLDARAVVRGTDEIAELAQAFNAMVPQLQNGLRMQHGLEIARAVQQNLLPVAPVHIPGFDIAGASEYCDETGGDYYDFVDLSRAGDQRLELAVGDVSGHGIGAALLMAGVRAALRASIDAREAPAASIGRANRLLCTDVGDGSFMTLALLQIDTGARTIVWVNAAHDAPAIYHRGSDTFLAADGADVPIGIEADWTYTEHTIELVPGEYVLALGTDGIWETENAAGVPYGRPRFRELVRAGAGRPAAEICASIMEDVAAYRGNAPPEDDVTLVIVAFTAKGPE